MKNYIGFDIGGTFVKGGIVDENGKLLVFDSIPTDTKNIVCDLAGFANKLLDKAGLSADKVEGIGMGIPGMIDSENGVVTFAGNLDWKNFAIAYELSAMTGFVVKITNDANAAALGEARFGAGKEYADSILVTLGTGVGGGIVIDGKLFSGRHSQGGEIGHMVIDKGGLKCTCGRRGCFEVYTSATALIRETKKAMTDNVDSKMWQDYTLDTVDGLTAFSHAKTDKTAARVIEAYEDNLACGLVNLANIFRPDVIMLGGGISNQGENLTKPLQKKFDKEIFAHGLGVPVPIVKASLGNKAGVLGAAAYAMDEI
ncbi:MAG: ROK family protein [Clostridia bacterium]|nr:ROK family protein [Clostridia bacterium]